MTAVVIGLDVGTTGVKAVAFGVDGGRRALVVREHPLLRPAPGHAVQDPDAVVTAAVSALAECVAAAGRPVPGIALGTAMHGLLALDAERRPITPLLTWADARAEEEARELHATGEAAELHRVSGTPVHPMSPLVKLLWFRRHEPGTWSRARWWIGLKDHLLLRLTGSLATELSSASATGLLDLATGG
ncbi:FGGY family carbohydrate kinase [Geodermatophilus sp. SYSU D00815]